MSVFYPAVTHLRVEDMRPTITRDGRGVILLEGTAFICVDSPLEARQMAVKWSDLANAMETTQRERGAVLAEELGGGQ